jgi:hypothetical protein
MVLEHKKDTNHGHHLSDHFHLCYNDIIELLKIDLENESNARYIEKTTITLLYFFLWVNPINLIAEIWPKASIQN